MELGYLNYPFINYYLFRYGPFFHQVFLLIKSTNIEVKKSGMAGILELGILARDRPGVRKFSKSSPEPGPEPGIPGRASPARV